MRTPTPIPEIGHLGLHVPAVGNTSSLRLPLLMIFFSDACHMGLLFNTWFCSTCGWEICSDCYLSLSDLEDGLPCQSEGGLHKSRACFFPITFFTKEDLTNTLSTMKGVLIGESSDFPHNLPIPKLPLPPTVEGSQWAPKYNLKELTDGEFSALLASGKPFVLVGVTDVKSMPKSIFNLNTDCPHPCTISHHDGTKWVEQKGSSLEEYFERWEDSQRWAIQVKVRIWFMTFLRILTFLGLPPPWRSQK